MTKSRGLKFAMLLLALLLLTAGRSAVQLRAEEAAGTEEAAWLLVGSDAQGTGVRVDVITELEKISSVTVYTVSEDAGTRRLKAFTADYIDGVYRAEGKWQDFAGEGVYSTWAVIRLEGGERVRSASSSFVLRWKLFSNVLCTKISEKKHYVRLRIFDAPILSIKEFPAAVWQKEDRSDLTWSSARWKKDGSWRVQADTGKFDLGEEEYHAGTLCLETAATPEGLLYGQETFALNGAALTVDSGTLRAVYPDRNAQDVLFAVWGEKDGQNDLVWYKASSEEGYLTADIPMKEHAESGLGYVQAWKQSEDGGFKADEPVLYTVSPAAKAQVRVTDPDERSCMQELMISQVSCRDDVEGVAAAIYSEEDLSDLHWYKAERTRSGDYTVLFDPSYHRLHKGTYTAKIYVETASGVFEEAVDCSFTPSGEEPRITVVQNGPSPLVTLGMENVPGTGQSLKSLRYVITRNDETDEAAASQTIRSESCEYGARTDVLLRNVGGPGRYTVTAIGSWENGFRQELAQTTVSYAGPRFEKAAEVLDRIGWDLFAAFRWSASLTYFGHNDVMPDTEFPGVRWYADYGFDNLQGNCYVMAATFYEMALNLGYKGRRITGGVGMRAGGIGPHSWVELDLEDGTFVFDPNFTNESGGNGFKIHYDDSGTWSYQRGHAMKMYDQR